MKPHHNLFPRLIALLFLAGCAHPAPTPTRTAPMGIDWTAAPTVAVALTDFAFTPSQLSFASGRPVRLLLSNTGSGRHDFAAPEFFAAASYRPGTALPAGGRIVVDGKQSAEIDLVPGEPGRYPLDCTEFLHSMFGMSGSIAVSPATPSGQ